MPCPNVAPTNFQRTRLPKYLRHQDRYATHPSPIHDASRQTPPPTLSPKPHFQFFILNFQFPDPFPKPNPAILHHQSFILHHPQTYPPQNPNCGLYKGHFLQNPLSMQIIQNMTFVSNFHDSCTNQPQIRPKSLTILLLLPI